MQHMSNRRHCDDYTNESATVYAREAREADEQANENRRQLAYVAPALGFLVGTYVIMLFSYLGWL